MFFFAVGFQEFPQMTIHGVPLFMEVHDVLRDQIWGTKSIPKWNHLEPWGSGPALFSGLSCASGALKRSEVPLQR